MVINTRLPRCNGIAVLFVISLLSPAFALHYNETLELLVPDISYFPDSLQLRQFTCRAVTANAYWLVQDTTFIDLPPGEDEFQLIWGNIVTQAGIDTISSQFEGAGVGVFESVTSVFGPVPETPNDDDRLWIVFADIRDYYPNPGAGATRLGNWAYVWPEDLDGNESTGNNHDIVYINVGPYKNMSGGLWEANRLKIHTWSVPTGLGQFLRTARNPQEEKWLVRGLGIFAQHLCYGLTSAHNGLIGIVVMLDDFARGGGIELTSWSSGRRGHDFGANLAAEFLWLKYIEQRFGIGVIGEIAMSSRSGMLNVATAIDPSVPEQQAVESVVYPVYESWLVTNLVSHIAGDFQGGIYSYGFLEGSGYDFTIINAPASFIVEFDAYPIPTWIAPLGYGMSAQVFAAQYAGFSGDYLSGGNTSVRFNGMYNQNNGSGPNIDGRWVVYRVVLSDDSTLASVDSLTFDNLFNGAFSLDGARTILVLTNGNPGGTAQIRYTLSQDSAEQSLVMAALQNGMNPFYLQVYSTLFREDAQIPSGFDWVGPTLDVSHLGAGGEPDSTTTVPMDTHSGTLWTARVRAWSPGGYLMNCSGYDSTGVFHENSLNFAVGCGAGGVHVLETPSARLVFQEGQLPQGAPAGLIETGVPGVPHSSMSETLSGILAGPVQISPGTGTISFPAESNRGSVYLLDEDRWLLQDSYFLEGRIHSDVTAEGIYALGDNPGVYSPEIPGTPGLIGVFPNPWNDRLSVRFSLPSPDNATLRLFDLSGRMVATLADGEFPAGLHSVLWNDCGVPAGLYFVRRETTNCSDTRKLIRMGSVR